MIVTRVVFATLPLALLFGCSTTRWRRASELVADVRNDEPNAEE